MTPFPIYNERKRCRKCGASEHSVQHKAVTSTALANLMTVDDFLQVTCLKCGFAFSARCHDTDPLNEDEEATLKVMNIDHSWAVAVPNYGQKPPPKGCP